jgi:hypothetical protein
VSCDPHGLKPLDFRAPAEAQSSFICIGQRRDAADASFAAIFEEAVLNQIQLAADVVNNVQLSPCASGPICTFPAIRFQ